MGIIKAAASAMSSTLKDQWKEYIMSPALYGDTIMTRGYKVVSEGSSNTGSDPENISEGSYIGVADGQTAIAVTGGKITGIYETPGEHILQGTGSSSVFNGTGVGGLMKDAWTKFTFGGEPVPISRTRIYYVNTKEIPGNDFSIEGIPVRITDERAGIEIDCLVEVAGCFSFRVTDPVKVYKRLIGYTGTAATQKDILLGQLESELNAIIREAVSGVGGVRPSQLFADLDDVCMEIKKGFTEKEHDLRGISMFSIGFTYFTVKDSYANEVFSLQRNAAFTDPSLAAANRLGSLNDAMVTAANNI